MDVNEFRIQAKLAVDQIADYYESLRDRPVLSDAAPGDVRKLIPDEAPELGEDMDVIFEDLRRIVLPGLTHWQSPKFYAYYPAGYSFPSIIGDLISSGLGVLGINWLSGPAITELEVAMLDWMGKLLDLPEEFLNCSEGPGGGIIKGTASEATFACLLAAKARTFQRIKDQRPDLTHLEIKGRLRGYSSDQSNSSIEKAGLMGDLHVHLLPSDEEGRLIPEALSKAIQNDLEEGLFPCYVVATLGTTGTCAFDSLAEIGPVCASADVWLHVDAAYGGAAFCCPEYRHLKEGLGYAHSFNFNPHKFMLVNFDCSALWVKDSKRLVDAFTVDRAYLKHGYDVSTEYLHWQLPLGRRFRALKLWFVLRSYGAEGIRRFIRRQVGSAEYLASLVESDARFELCSQSLALVCFRLKGDNSLTQTLHDRLMQRRNIYLLSYAHKGRVMLRMSVNSNEACEKDLDFAWREIREVADDVVAVKTVNGKKGGFNLQSRIKCEDTFKI